ncbi:MAG: 3-phosphoshikimate 1-carboxyvinyltransferase [Gaiellaceae bacterium]
MIRIEPATALVGDIAVPAVKGICQRAALLASIADGESEIRGFGHAADTDTALEVVRALGAEVGEPGPGTIRVRGTGLRGLRAPAGPIDCRNAGTVLRLLSGILAGQPGTFVLSGDESLCRRPHERIAIPLRQMGARVETTDGSCPLTIEGGRLSPVSYVLPMASAQVKSAILLAGLLAEGGPTTVIEPATTRDHTERMLSSLGIRVERRGSEISVWPVERIPPLDLDVPGDFSSAAPFLAAATLLPGSELRIHGVNLNPTRTGFLSVLERMGARITAFNRRSEGGEPVGDLDVRSAELVATAIQPGEVPNVVDELPLFVLIASMAHGESVVHGAEELRAKESDRIRTTTEAMRALGGHVQERPDGFRIRGVPTRLRGGLVEAHADHRIAMLAGVAGLASSRGVELDDPDCAAVSFPGFFDLLDMVARRTPVEEL